MTVNVKYFAALRAERGETDETVTTESRTARDLYRELAELHKLTLREDILAVSINRQMTDLDAVINDGDEVVFIPPVAGG